MDRPNPFKDPRVLVAIGTGVVAVAALAAVGVVFMSRPKAPAPVGADHGMLQVQMGKGDDKLDPAKPLRCFVSGQFVGQATLAECAAKNGVAAQNLDVGLDPSGQIAAQAGAVQPLSPLPQPDAAGQSGLPSDVSRNVPSVSADEAASDGPPCLRYSGGSWRPAGEGLSLKACVHALYEDRCVRQGEALYGRYGPQTLRLVPGRVEVSGDNRNFRQLVPQDPDACALED